VTIDRRVGQGRHGSPRVSVVIPTFNHAAYLPDAIDSVLTQSFSDLEVIVVDDGSTDETPEVVRRFTDGRVRNLRQENRGLSAARNAGIAASRGSLVALLDADDLYEPHFLQVMVGVLDEHRDAGAAYCGYRFVDRENRALQRAESRVVPPERFADVLLEGNFLVPASVVARRASYEAVGPFDSSLRACEDWDMWLRMSRRFTFVGTSLRLVRYRLLSQSMSSVPAHMARYRLAVLGKHLDSAPGTTGRRERALALGHLRNAVEYLEAGDLRGAGEHLRLMARAHAPMVTDTGTFYEIACASQPRGCRGDVAWLDLGEAESLLDRSLTALSCGDQLSGVTSASKGRARATAYLALATLAYARGDLPATRRCLIRAVVRHRSVLGHQEFLALSLRSLLSRRIVHAVRRRRIARASAVLSE
jgi:hypothetical protein